MAPPRLPARLMPWWYTPLALFLIGMGPLIFLALSLVADGLMGWSYRVACAACALLLVSASSALVRPRRRQEPRLTAAGVRVFRSPAATVWPLVGSALGLFVVAVVWGYVVITDFDAIEAPKMVVPVLLGAGAGVPNLVRLFTGQLYRWQVEIGPDTITYQGYRTHVTYPWSDVHGARYQPKDPAGVVIDVRGGGKDPVVPLVAFGVPPEQLIEEIQRAKNLDRKNPAELSDPGAAEHFG